MLLIAGCAAAPESIPVAAAPTHPLDPLTLAELESAVSVLRAEKKIEDDSRLPLLVLREPPKEEVLAWKPGAPLRREAFAVVLDRAKNRTSEAVIDLARRRVASWKEVPGVQPSVLNEELEKVPDLVRADPRWQAAMRRRGIADFEKVLVDAWAPGVLPPDAPAARLLRAITFFRGEQKNAYGRPVEGVVALVDMTAGRVVEVTDTGARPLARAVQDLDEASNRPLRAPPRPLVTETPDGPSFELRGNEVRWQGWRFRWGFHPREGLVLYTVGFEDRGRLRSILYRAALSEMVVPYGDPDANWAWRAAFDEGEYGLGRLADSLEPGRDAPAHATLLDALMAGDAGEPRPLQRAVALYERDGGLLWKHYDYFAEKAETRRARELCMSFTATVGNYDYALTWIFRQDGALELEVALTGILLVKGVAAARCVECDALASGPDAAGPRGEQRFGRLVGESVLAPNHQHFFCVRLDFDIDGRKNSVVEMRTHAALPGENPRANAFVMEESLLRTELGARRDLEPGEHRLWKVVNPAARGALGHLAGYVLCPGESARPLMTPESATRRRAGFTDHALAVTRYRAEEMSAAGDYPNQGRAPEGLSRFAARDESIVDEDVVVWYTFGVTHTPRPEDWPVMPVARAGFRLEPDGFFGRNPALDVPDADDR